jgi:hypothetical protein
VQRPGTCQSDARPHGNKRGREKKRLRQLGGWEATELRGLTPSRGKAATRYECRPACCSVTRPSGACRHPWHCPFGSALDEHWCRPALAPASLAQSVARADAQGSALMQRLCLVCPTCDPQSRAFPIKRERPAVKRELIRRRDVYAEAFDFVMRANTSGLRRPMLLYRLANISWST